MAEWIVSSSILILIIVLLRAFLKGRISPRLQYALWLIVLLRLLMSVSPFESPLSVMGLIEAANQTRAAAAQIQSEPVSRSEAEGHASTPASNSVEVSAPSLPSVPVDVAVPADTSTPAVSQQPRLSLPTAVWLYALWALGAAAVLVLALCINRRSGQLLRRGARPLPGQGTMPPKRIYISPAPCAPCLFGLFSPAIFVPEELALHARVLGHVLSHERAHYRQGDHIWSALRVLALALHWYNPLVWLACVLSRRDAEAAADAAAIAALGEEARTDYGKTLVHLVSRTARPGDLLSCGTAMYGTKRTVKERIRLIARGPRTALITLIAVILVCTAAVTLTYTGTGHALPDPAAPGAPAAPNGPEAPGTPTFPGSTAVSAPENLSGTVPAESIPGKTVYKIPEDAYRGPTPDPDRFGSTFDPGDIQAVIDAAAELLDGQKTIFDPKAAFQPGKEISYYRDETILAVTWKEILDGKCCTFSEVKIADGSQLRREYEGVTGSPGTRLASELAKDVASVVAINGDFYEARSLGFSVRARQARGDIGEGIDSCFLTASGDLLLSYAGEFQDMEQVQRFVEENDVISSLSFGPILVDNGHLRTITEYPLGEINNSYSRSAIGQLDELHYLLMTVNYDEGYTVTATIQEAARFMHDKGCIRAYALDGGQTSELLMQGEPVNHIDFGIERAIKDILYFATALPES